MLLGPLQMQCQSVLSNHHLNVSSPSPAPSTEFDNLTHHLYYPLATHPASYHYQQYPHSYQHRLSVKPQDSVSNPRTTPSSLDSCSSPVEASSSSPYFAFGKSSSSSSRQAVSASYDSRSLTTVPVTSASMYSMKVRVHSLDSFMKKQVVRCSDDVTDFLSFFHRKQLLSGQELLILEFMARLLPSVSRLELIWEPVLLILVREGWEELYHPTQVLSIGFQ